MLNGQVISLVKYFNLTFSYSIVAILIALFQSLLWPFCRQITELVDYPITPEIIENAALHQGFTFWYYRIWQLTSVSCIQYA